MSKTNTVPPNKLSKKKIILNVIGIILCLILIPILVINCILIVKGLTNKDEVPSIGGNAPLVVLTGSMDPTIKAGDLIVCKKIDAEEIQEGDVIAFFDPEGNGSSIVTHRVIRIDVDPVSGEISFRTQGDNNDIADMTPVPAENLVGIWTGTRIGGLGYVVLFTQSTVGLIVIIAVVVAAIIIYLIVRKRIQDKEKQGDIDSLKAELEALKAEKSHGGENSATAEAENAQIAESSPPESDGSGE